MQTSMKPLFMRERAMHFLEDTVVHSMEGVLFASLSTLFTLAGAAVFLEDSRWLAGGAEMTAAAPTPAAPVLADRPPQPIATLQQASYVLPTVR
jgi:hypothetical protein